MKQERPTSRRRYSAQHKSLVLEQCDAPGASVAKVALTQGINANLVHRWRSAARRSAVAKGVSEFVPVSLSSSTLAQGRADIRIELCRGATTMAITWPCAAASECAAWMRELLR